ncbi:hypothetical protein ACQHIV_37700 [Kribbella sp. GL6]|uniref:hypothetical protein n=1 Tax=Kribbella sp. GL6 TaxID=3419765 RepID=UPI003D07EB79
MHKSFRAAALGGAVALGLVVTGLVAAPANAASIGTVTLSETTGSINAGPFVTSAKSSGPCPAAYSQGASLDVMVDTNGDGTLDPVSERFSLGPTLNEGGYDKVPFVEVKGVAGTARTLETRLQGRKGEFELRITCLSMQFEPAPDYYSTKIVVEGDTWRLKDSTPPPTGGVKGEEKITTTVQAPAEQLTMTVGDDGQVTLPTPALAGDRLSSSGQLDPVTVTDNRSAKPGWNTTAQVSAFSSGANTFDGKYLGWTPSVVSQSSGQGVVAGAAVAPGFSAGTGLSEARPLGSAPAGSGIGSAVLGAGLSLELPTTTPAGTYVATLTLTTL